MTIARAAGTLPVGGKWQQLRDFDGPRATTADDRSLGMSGALSQHRSNFEAINQTYMS